MGKNCLLISGWDRWQTYRKDRGTPPWIKVYRNLLTNPEWATLSDAEKGQLVSIWIIAADKGGKVPSDPKVLRKICQLDDQPDTKKLTELGFLSTKRLPPGNHKSPKPPEIDAPETETETETETEGKLVATFLADSILERDPNYRFLINGAMEKTVNSWAKDIDKIIRLDNRDAGIVWEVTRWCVNDDFWCKNILSGAKLREKFSDLVLKIPRISNTQNNDITRGKTIQ